MQRLLLLLIIPAVLTSCLKHDVLKKETNTSFRESDFYTSGEFQREFDIVILDTQIVTTKAPDGTKLCQPIFTFGLTDNFIQQLEAHWEDEIEIIISEEKPTSGVETYRAVNYSTKFRTEQRGKVECGQQLYFYLQLNLIDPGTGRVVASTTTPGSNPKEFFISTP